MAELHRMQNLRVDPRLAGQLVGVHWITFAVATGNGPHLAPRRYDDLVTQFGEPLAGPERVGAGFSREARGRERPKASLKGRAGTSPPALLLDLPGGIEQAKLAPRSPKSRPTVKPEVVVLIFVIFI
jgi:hypothetical protein